MVALELPLVVFVVMVVLVVEETPRPVNAAQTRTTRDGLPLFVLLLLLEGDRCINLGNVEPLGGSYPPLPVVEVLKEVERLGVEGAMENRWKGWTVVDWCKPGIPYILSASATCAATCGSAVGLMMPLLEQLLLLLSLVLLLLLLPAKWYLGMAVVSHNGTGAGKAFPPPIKLPPPPPMIAAESGLGSGGVTEDV